MSSKAVSRVFQLASAKSFKIDGGMISAARASASSGVCLYLKVSSAAGAAGGGALDGFAAEEAGAFFAGADEGPAAAAGGFFAWKTATEHARVI